VIPPNSRLICGTRVSHLDSSTWGEDANVWDGRRFFDEVTEKTAKEEGGTELEKSKRARRVWGFGGGISRVSSMLGLYRCTRSDAYVDFRSCSAKDRRMRLSN